MSETPRTDAVAHAGYDCTTYICRMTSLSRDLERELAATQELLAESMRRNANVTRSAQELARLGKGVPRKITEEERGRRRKRMAFAREKRWNKSTKIDNAATL